jgi:hypothetical protein
MTLDKQFSKLIKPVLTLNFHSKNSKELGKKLATKATKLVFSILNSQKCHILHPKNLWYWEYYSCTFCRFVGPVDQDKDIVFRFIIDYSS